MKGRYSEMEHQIDQNQDDLNEVSVETTEEDMNSDNSKEESEKVESVDQQTHERMKHSLLADLHKERSTRKSLQEKVTQLEKENSKNLEVNEKYKLLQARYTRLEEFVLHSGTVLENILDSRSFSEKLFDSDIDIKELVKEWNSKHPSKMNEALRSNSRKGSEKSSLNTLFRASVK